jgi:peptidoglycan/LPS O-acetylase OafA/YrhL
MTDFKYRADVDGLRAVAVILVLLFHAGLGFSGGFIGVDVFFVISGFLITGLILKEQESGKFSLANFWVRRIRRIIPAATVMVVTVLIAGFFLLLPSDYEDLGKSIIAQQLMVSNVYFWRNTGYFDGPADLKPLLHTWSLAVEEQFYLVYPFLLMLLHRFGRRATFVTLTLLGLGSLAISEYGVQHHPSATFFMLPTRAWELLIGGLICFFPKPKRIPSWMLAACSWFSLATILGAGWFYTSTIPFPGLYALVPCVATAALIYSNSLQLSFPATVLATKPVVFVGLISYSLYLWHWPILAYSRYWIDTRFEAAFSLVAIVVSFPIAIASWKYVETPVRRRQKSLKSLSVALPAVISASLIISLGLYVYVQNGLTFRIPHASTPLLEATRSKYFIEVNESQVKERQLPCWKPEGSSKSKVLLWGDSHAQSIAAGLVAACEEKQTVCYQATNSDTPPLLGFDSSRIHTHQASPRFNQAVFEFARDEDIALVFLCASWAKYAEVPGFEAALQNTVNGLNREGILVVIVRDYPCGRNLSPKVVLMRTLLGLEPDIGISLSEHKAKNESVNEVFDGHRSQNIWIEDPAPYFEIHGQNYSALVQGLPAYFDPSHLTAHGGLLLKHLFSEVLDRSGAEGNPEKRVRELGEPLGG